MRILYLHGLHSQPGGTKPSYLLGRGYEVLNPALGDDDFERSVRVAQQAFHAGRPQVVVGSSRGGAVAMNIDTGAVPLVLVAPAWKFWGTATTVKHGTNVLHSEHDDVVPFTDSRALVEVSGLEPSALVAVGADHNMVDEAALEALVAAIEQSRLGP